VLSPGAKLGPYEVVGPLGAGGMGEVYRARDASLNRDVAIKILPDAFAGDPDCVARFTREAQTLAALNHPGTLGGHAAIASTTLATEAQSHRGNACHVAHARKTGRFDGAPQRGATAARRPRCE